VTYTIGIQRSFNKQHINIDNTKYVLSARFFVISLEQTPTTNHRMMNVKEDSNEIRDAKSDCCATKRERMQNNAFSNK